MTMLDTSDTSRFSCECIWSREDFSQRSTRSRCRVWLAVAATVLIAANSASPDEGYWSSPSFPFNLVEESYNVKLDREMLKRAQMATVRIVASDQRESASGRRIAVSGVLVGLKGLVVSSRHGVLDLLSTWSHRRRYTSGFCASEVGEEVQCPTIEVEVLRSETDVTSLVMASERNGESSTESTASRAERIAAIVESANSKDMTVDVVEGNDETSYTCYEYQRFRDVRLVALPAPVGMIAANSGRDAGAASIDVALLRVMHEGVPFVPWASLAVNPRAVGRDELLLAFGYPDESMRSWGSSEASFAARVALPLRGRLLDSLLETAKLDVLGRGEAVPSRTIECLQAERKRIDVELFGLTDSSISSKRSAELTVLDSLRSVPRVWCAFALLLQSIDDGYQRYQVYARQHLLSQLWGATLSLAIRMGVVINEYERPEFHRDRAYLDRSIEIARKSLPRAPSARHDLDCAILRATIEFARQELGNDDLLVKAMLQSGDSHAVASAAFRSTLIDDARYLESILNGDLMGSAWREDSLLCYMVRLAPVVRELELDSEADVGTGLYCRKRTLASMTRLAGGVTGSTDADGTLRTSYGRVRSWEWGKSRGSSNESLREFLRRTADDGYVIYPRWSHAIKDMDDLTVHRICADFDVLAGHSGGPVVGVDGKLVGIIVASSGSKYAYNADRARGVVLCMNVIREVLLHVHGAERLLIELECHVDGQVK